MSILNQISRISGKVADSYTAVSNKGGTLPQSQVIANLPTAIASIPAGGSLPDITTAQEASGADIVDGKKAYDDQGNLLTGTGLQVPSGKTAAGSNQILSGYSAFVKDVDGNNVPYIKTVNGGITTNAASGNTSLTPASPSVSFPGQKYYSSQSNHGATVLAADATIQKLKADNLNVVLRCNSSNNAVTGLPEENAAKFMTSVKVATLDGDIYRVKDGFSTVTAESNNVVVSVNFVPIFACIYMVSQRTSTVHTMICAGSEYSINQDGTENNFGQYRAASSSSRLWGVESSCVSWTANGSSYDVTFAPDSASRHYQGIYYHVIIGR